MSSFRSLVEPTDDEHEWLSALPRPHLLVMIGGPIRYWAMTLRHLTDALLQLLARATQCGGSLIVTGSPRTPGGLIERVRTQFASATNIRFVDGMARFQVLMQDADELFPTGDSISMISESVITGKPVGIVRMEQSLSGRILLGPEARIGRTHFRDLRRFWTYLQRHRLAGTVEEPVAAMIDNPVIKAAFEVRELISGEG
jgi:hypothetical protein